jgi:hypothetical protein
MSRSPLGSCMSSSQLAASNRFSERSSRRAALAMSRPARPGWRPPADGSLCGRRRTRATPDRPRRSRCWSPRRARAAPAAARARRAGPPPAPPAAARHRIQRVAAVTQRLGRQRLELAADQRLRELPLVLADSRARPASPRPTGGRSARHRPGAPAAPPPHVSVATPVTTPPASTRRHGRSRPTGDGSTGGARLVRQARGDVRSQPRVVRAAAVRSR